MTRDDYRRFVERAKRAEKRRDQAIIRANLKVEAAWRECAEALAKLMERHDARTVRQALRS